MTDQSSPDIAALREKIRTHLVQMCLASGDGSYIHHNATEVIDAVLSVIPDAAATPTDRDQLIALADDIRAAQRDYMADRGNHEKGRAVAAAANAYDKARESLVSVQNIAATPTNRQLHDAIARAVTHRTYSGIQDAVREIQKLYGDLAQTVRGPSEPLQCLRCGTIDAFGPVSKTNTSNG